VVTASRDYSEHGRIHAETKFKERHGRCAVSGQKGGGEFASGADHSRAFRPKTCAADAARFAINAMPELGTSSRTQELLRNAEQAYLIKRRELQNRGEA